MDNLIIKDVKEVLHFYMGCDFTHEDDFYSLTYHKVNGYFIDRWNDNCVLLLKPMGALTNEEIIELCRLYYPKPFERGYRIPWVVDWKHAVDGMWVEVSHNRSEHSFTVDFEDPTITVYEKGEDGCPQYCPMPYIMWLTKNGFDIFGLIKRKMAEEWIKQPPVIVD